MERDGAVTVDTLSESNLIAHDRMLMFYIQSYKSALEEIREKCIHMSHRQIIDLARATLEKKYHRRQEGRRTESIAD